MYWLYFTRDFYRAAQQGSAAQKQMSEMQSEAQTRPAMSAQIACVVMREPAPAPTPRQRPRRAAKRQVEYVVRSEVVCSEEVTVPRYMYYDEVGYEDEISFDGEAGEVPFPLREGLGKGASSESLTINTPLPNPPRKGEGVHRASLTNEPQSSIPEYAQFAPASSNAQAAPPASSPLAAYLQRLGADGEHAFGVWDEDAGFSMFSANFDRVTGLSSGECAGHDWIHAIHHTQQYAVNDALLGAVDGMDGRCLVQARRLKEGADERWLLMDVKAPRSEQAQVMVMFRDLTEQTALEEALKQTEAALAVSERSRAAFLSSMSHELRTPLNAIMGFSEMMKSAVFGDLGNPTYKEYAKHIHDSGSQLLGKINDLLDIASMDVGGLEIEEEEFSLSTMLNESVEVYSHQAFERQQRIKLDCPHKLEILGDRAKLMCATAHLLTNALRHSGDAAEVTISVRVQADEGVIISVRDAGEGISAAQLETIRTALAADVAYFNIESGGIGLGLSLTKELASRHGGRVMIDSVRHRGTVVSMILPTARVLSGMPKGRRRSQ